MRACSSFAALPNSSESCAMAGLGAPLALDAETEARIQRTLDKIMVGRTSFTITHRMSTAMKADVILVLDDGRLVEQGNHEQLMNRKGLYYNVFQQQLGENT